MTRRRDVITASLLLPFARQVLRAQVDEVSPPADHCAPLASHALIREQLKTAEFATIQEAVQRKRPAMSNLDMAELAETYRAVNSRIAASEVLQRQLRKQIDLHQLYCGGDPKADIPNIHSSCYFLPWHRGLVYFHEKFLRKVLEDDDFRIPVFDWDVDETIPAGFPTGWPLPQAPARAVKVIPPIPTPVLQSWIASEDWATFAGDGGTSNGGVHTFVHTHLGRPMADPPSAAFDPIFFCHHANVDRYWLFWSQTHPHDYGDARLCFYDGDKLVSVAVANLMNVPSLGYTYDNPPHASFFRSRKSLNFEINDVPFLNGRHDLAGKFLSDLTGSNGWDWLRSIFHLPHNPSIPFRWSLRIPDYEPNHYYGLALQSTSDAYEQCLLGGFGVFGDAPNENRLWATGTFNAKVVKFLVEHPFKRHQLVYGQFDVTGDHVNGTVLDPLNRGRHIAFLQPA